MKITLSKLKELDACQEGVDWFEDKYKAKKVDLLDLRSDLEAEDEEEWFNWLLTRLLNRDNRIKYAIYAAELVLPIFEKEFPNDDRPRAAIEAAKSGNACKDAAYAAWDAAYAVDVARAAAYAAAYAAWAAAYAANAAAWAAVWAVEAARDADADGKKEIYKKILNFGFNLLEKQEEIKC